MIALATRARGAAELAAARGARADALRLLRPGRGRRGRLCRGLPADVQPSTSASSTSCSALVGLPPVDWFSEPDRGDGADHHRRHLALGRLQRHHHPVGPPVDPRGRLRGRDARPGLAGPAVPLHHPAAADAGDPVLRRALGHRHDAAVRRAVPDHQPRRAGRRDRDARALPLPAGLHRAELRLRLGGRLHDRGDRGADLGAQPLAREGARHEVQASARALRAARAPRGAGAAGARLAVAALDDGGLLDHARERHLQPEIELLPSDQFWTNFRAAAGGHRLPAHDLRLGRRRAGLHRRSR